MKEGLTDTIRQAIRRLSGDNAGFHLSDLAKELGIETPEDRMRMRNALRNLRIRGEIVKTGHARYRRYDDPDKKHPEPHGGNAPDGMTLARRIRNAAEALGTRGKPFTAKALARQASIQTPLEKKHISTAIRDLLRAGEIERLERGVYRWLGKQSKPQIQEVMWRILRARRTVTIEDLQELSGASREYAREWLGMLIRQEYVKKLSNGRYALADDPIDMPSNEGKIEKLRRLRERQRRTLSSLDAAFAAIAEARMAVAQLDMEG